MALLQLVYGHMFFEQEYRIDDAGLCPAAQARRRGCRARIADGRRSPATAASCRSTQHGTPTGRSRSTASSPTCTSARAATGSGQSLLRSAWKAWVLKDPTLKTWVQTIDRNGMGVPVYTGAEDEQDLERGPRHRARACAPAATPARRSPNGATLEGKGVKGDLPDAEPLVRYLDEQIARAVLAHFLNLGTQTGSWALGSVFADCFTQSLQGFAETIADIATQHIVEDWVDLNFGPDEPAPRIVFEEIGSQQAATAQALKMLVDAGADLPRPRDSKRPCASGTACRPRTCRRARPRPLRLSPRRHRMPASQTDRFRLLARDGPARRRRRSSLSSRRRAVTPPAPRCCACTTSSTREGGSWGVSAKEFAAALDELPADTAEISCT